VYVVGYSMELASQDMGTLLFWNKLQYIGILGFPSIYLIFTIQFTGAEKWLTRTKIVLLFTIPAILLVIKFFDGSLQLIYASAELVETDLGVLLSFKTGPLYYFVVAYNLIIVTIGSYLILQKRRFSSFLYRKQTGLILMAATIIYLVYIVYLAGIQPFHGLEYLDLNPFAYTVWGCAIGFTIFRHRLFDLTPIARDALIEMLSDGVIVLDSLARVVDANPQAQKIFDWHPLPVGKPVESLMENWIDQSILTSISGSTRLETQRTNADRQVYYEVTVSTLRDKHEQLIGYLILVHDISERKEVEKELHELSLMDDLTGLTNRRGFTMLSAQMMSMANRMELNAVLFYMDMDELKAINDNLGHTVGDQALIDLALVLKNTFRSSDIIARLGGDEFVVLAADSLDKTGGVLLERLQARLQAHLDAYNQRIGQKFQLSLSIGHARYDWKKPSTIETLLQQADKSMYENKQTRKSTTEPTPLPAI
jgi:diguanylate cyclase (GGDEF)-like protein/PAS domain S-box-containing protein